MILNQDISKSTQAIFLAAIAKSQSVQYCLSGIVILKELKYIIMCFCTDSKSLRLKILTELIHLLSFRFWELHQAATGYRSHFQ